MCSEEKDHSCISIFGHRFIGTRLGELTMYFSSFPTCIRDRGVYFKLVGLNKQLEGASPHGDLEYSPGKILKFRASEMAENSSKVYKDGRERV